MENSCKQIDKNMVHRDSIIAVSQVWVNHDADVASRERFLNVRPPNQINAISGKIVTGSRFESAGASALHTSSLLVSYFVLLVERFHLPYTDCNPRFGNRGLT